MSTTAQTALFDAARAGDVTAFRQCVADGADPAASEEAAPGEHGWAAIHIAMSRGDVELLQVLLLEFKVDPNTFVTKPSAYSGNRVEMTPLHIVAEQWPQQNGEDYSEGRHWPATMTPAQCKKVICLLVWAGADLSIISRDTKARMAWTPLALAESIRGLEEDDLQALFEEVSKLNKKYKDFCKFFDEAKLSPLPGATSSPDDRAPSLLWLASKAFVEKVVGNSEETLESYHQSHFPDESFPGMFRKLSDSQVYLPLQRIREERSCKNAAQTGGLRS